MRASPLVNGSVVVGAAVAILNRGRALGRSGFAMVRSLVMAKPAACAPVLDRARLDAALNAGWLVAVWRSVEEALDRAWRGSATRQRLANLTAEIVARSPADRARLAGWALASALAANAAVTRFAALVHGSPWLAAWALLAVVALALITKPGAIVAAWMHRTR